MHSCIWGNTKQGFFSERESQSFSVTRSNLQWFLWTPNPFKVVLDVLFSSVQLLVFRGTIFFQTSLGEIPYPSEFCCKLIHEDKTSKNSLRDHVIVSWRVKVSILHDLTVITIKIGQLLVLSSHQYVKNRVTRLSWIIELFFCGESSWQTIKTKVTPEAVLCRECSTVKVPFKKTHLELQFT